MSYICGDCHLEHPVPKSRDRFVRECFGAQAAEIHRLNNLKDVYSREAFDGQAKIRHLDLQNGRYRAALEGVMKFWGSHEVWGDFGSLTKAACAFSKVADACRESLGESSDCAKKRISVLEPGPLRGCLTCGDKLAVIRGRHPGDADREVCPTCATERWEDHLSSQQSPAKET